MQILHWMGEFTPHTPPPPYPCHRRRGGTFLFPRDREEAFLARSAQPETADAGESDFPMPPCPQQRLACSLLCPTQGKRSFLSLGMACHVSVL